MDYQKYVVYQSFTPVDGALPPVRQHFPSQCSIFNEYELNERTFGKETIMNATKQVTVERKRVRASVKLRSIKLRLAFHHGFAAGATLAPLLLVIYVYWHSGDAAVRARMIVGGLELTVLALVLALAVRMASRWAANRLAVQRRGPIIDYVPF